ncbi:ABC transporter permease [Helicobacter sp. MIT 14-3879]|uniref:MlaE family ABC transporter permease n=1 Tax=Helicobacter sp. MIT 14-3879 TaxID=2040649 RepID=UPI000E1F510B|nr:ABC transporter permease [Helicobacter sp. MIT 14-3879]RDU62276.1 ABC transporter [Helicobacter sp. MIT 14-3879]
MINSKINKNEVTIILQGEFSTRIAKQDIENMQSLFDNPSIKQYIINLDSISKFDFTFLIFLFNYTKKLKDSNKDFRLLANNANAIKIVNLLKEIEINNSSIPIVAKENIFTSVLKQITSIKNLIYDYNQTLIDFINFLGILIYTLVKSLFNPRNIRYKAINYHIFNGVISAMPVIFIVSFIVGGVIAYQGAATLSRMGFIQASVEMTAKLTLREIGPFVVALIVAGRSASSYTAQIGVMKMTEEIDAMKIMKLNLLNFIVIPRFIALIISFPFMVFLSDLVSIFGCMVFLKFGFGISFYDYILQIKEYVGMNSFWTGIIKAPFYAAVIVIIGCFIGFRVEDNTQSVGEKTTTSVVCALFGVILINALFSLIFTELKF